MTHRTGNLFECKHCSSQEILSQHYRHETGKLMLRSSLIIFLCLPNNSIRRNKMFSNCSSVHRLPIQMLIQYTFSRKWLQTKAVNYILFSTISKHRSWWLKRRVPSLWISSLKNQCVNSELRAWACSIIKKSCDARISIGIRHEKFKIEKVSVKSKMDQNGELISKRKKTKYSKLENILAWCDK